MLILSKVMNKKLEEPVCLDLANWFASSLRGKTNKLCHYLDQIEQCGNYVEQFVRESFFRIINSILGMIKRSKN